MIHCAIIGLGRIGSTLEDDTKREKPASHAGAINMHPDCAITAGCDTDTDKLNAFGKRWKCTHLYSDPDIMLDKHPIDILHIAVPPESHLEYLKKAIDKKIPVILCEKPLAHTLTAAKTMFTYSKNKSSVIVINHERRYALPYRHTRDVITSMKYGKLISLYAKVYMGFKKKCSQVLLDDGTHMIDVIRFLTGRDIRVESTWGEIESREHPFFVLMKAGETPVVLEISSSRDHIVFELDLGFQSGRIRIGNGLYEEWESRESPYYDNMKSPVLTDTAFSKTEYFKGMFADAVNIIKGKKQVPVSTIQDGYEAMKIIDKIVNN